MKTLIAAAMLLALIVPAHASKFRASDRKWLPIIATYQVFRWRMSCRHQRG